jgi:hypothetical protein
MDDSWAIVWGLVDTNRIVNARAKEGHEKSSNRKVLSFTRKHETNQQSARLLTSLLGARNMCIQKQREDRQAHLGNSHCCAIVGSPVLLLDLSRGTRYF